LESTRFIARLDEAALESLAFRLPVLMERRGFSQKELSRRSSVSANNIKSAVDGSHKPTLGKLLAIAAALGVSMDALFGDEVPGAFVDRFRDP
jgi:transcriptional regulator with XRE-family HTH domain